jgi:hypothetical protein
MDAKDGEPVMNGSGDREGEAEPASISRLGSSTLDLTGAAISQSTADEGDLAVLFECGPIRNYNYLEGINYDVKAKRTIPNSVFVVGQKRRDAPSILLPHQDADYISHIALDIGGSLIKLVYFSPDAPSNGGKRVENGSALANSNSRHGGT